jgi:hypothetical protein
MTTFSIPAMSAENEFHDLVFVGRYVDKLLESSGDLDYAIVYEWDDRGPGEWPPVAVLARLNGKWWRREVLVTVARTKTGVCKFDLELAEESVNGH